MRVGVLCSRIRVEEKLLFEALTARGVAYEKLDDRLLTFNLHDPRPYQQYDIILERSINHSRALYALEMFNDWGIKTVNRARWRASAAISSSPPRRSSNTTCQSRVI